MFAWSIQKKITVLLVSLIVLIIINIISMFEIAKTGYFTFLEREHIVGVESIRLNIDKISNSSNDINNIKKYIDNPSTDFKELGIVQGLNITNQQAELCLGAINFAEDILFRVLGFGEAIDVCKEAIETNKQLKALALSFKSNKLTPSEFLSQVTTPFVRLNDHSERFAVLIPEIRTFMVNLIVTTTIVLSLALIIAFILTLKSIQSNLSNLRTDIREVEKNNELSYIVRIVNNDEISEVGKSFKNLLKKFKDIIVKISLSNNSLTDESKKLKILAEQSNSSVTAQFEMTHQLSNAIEKMTMAIDEVATNINQVASSADNVNHSAEKGQEVVGIAINKLTSLVSEMSTATEVVSNLAASSEQVSTVLEVITQIAEQTNLLALNAAIEAARAGEHGRGFAVVSDEVRALANRTQQSTQEISEIISQLKSNSQNAISAMAKSQQQVEDTMTTANSAGEMLTDITQLSRHITDSVAQVAISAEEQTNVLKDININIEILGKSAGTAKDIAEKTHQSASILNDNAESMTNVVSAFKV